METKNLDKQLDKLLTPEEKAEIEVAAEKEKTELQDAKKAEEAKVVNAAKTTEKSKRGSNEPKKGKYELLVNKTYVSTGLGIERLNKGSILKLTEKQANSFKFRGKLKKVG